MAILSLSGDAFTPYDAMLNTSLTEVRE